MKSVRKQSIKIKTPKKNGENVAKIKRKQQKGTLLRAWDACGCRLICNLANVSKQLERFIHVSFRITISYQDRLD